MVEPAEFTGTVFYTFIVVSHFLSADLSCRPGLVNMWPAGRILNSSIIHFNKHNRSAEQNTSTLLADKKKLKKLRGLSPRANYTDRAAAAGRRS